MQASGRRFIWHGSATDTFKLVYFSDIHWLAKACAEKEVLKTRDEILNDPFTFWIGGGDYGEFIGFGDAKRFDPDAVSERVSVADLARLGKRTYEEIRDLFAPIKHKCLGLIVGNHEKQYMRRLQQEDLHGWLCTELGVADLGYSCFMDVVFQQVRGQALSNGYEHRASLPSLESRSLSKANHAGSNTFRVWCHHGAGAAQTKGGKINRLTTFMRNFDADIFFMGHVHDQMGARLTPLCASADCTKISNRTKLGVISGSYLKTYAQGVTTYGEMKGYEPVTLGAAFVTIHPDTREMAGRV
jgi:predicted phosphodiesterase